ncbi:major facilitator superfamily [Cordyceps militaris]|uniref:Major facilitator superfamily n=1 Tax=Cordyceps militaris TaxID=73501 RepID=A0A2H4SW51_CORMI|nr:major facilitator superfamily [Cordyceps militaris]
MASPSPPDAANDASPTSSRLNVHLIADHSSQPSGHDDAASPWRFWLLAVGICLSLFLSMIDSSVVSTSLYTIGLEFKAPQSVNWVALAYSLAQVGCAATFAQLSDIIGRRNILIAANAIFFASSLACGFSKNIHQLIAFRALQGVGGSGLYSMPMIVLPEICPIQLKQYIAAVVAIVVAGSSVLGPVLGGFLTNYATWRWVFWLNGPICFLSMLALVLLWPPVQSLPIVPRQSWKSFDAIGTFLLISAAVLVVFAFQKVGESGSGAWSSAIFIAPLTIGTASWVMLVAWEYFVNQRMKAHISPTFPVALFRNRRYVSGILTTLATGYPLLLIIFSSTTRVQVVSGKSALMSGVMLLPMLGTIAIGGMLAGKVNQTNYRVSETIIAGACLVLVGCGLLATVRGAADDAKALGFLVFPGLGFGLLTTAATIMATVESSPQNRASAQGALTQLRMFGGSLGISASTVLLHREISKLSSNPEMRLSAREWEAVRVAYSEAFRKCMLSATVVSAAGVLFALGGYWREKKPTEEHRQGMESA